jgi:trehalose 6-phosphate phosphatase
MVQRRAPCPVRGASLILHMTPFFTPDGERALARVMQLRPLLAFDFDGTLAPIVTRPDDAGVPERVARRLEALAQRLPVAIITGRSIADVRPRLGFMPGHVIGNHGAEVSAADATSDARVALDPLRAAIRRDADDLAVAGVQVEDKGLSLALHYRVAADPAAAQERIDSLLAGSAATLKRFGGKFVVNVMAAGLPDKGDALFALVASTGAGAAVFIGDDVNDEAVFARARAPWLTIRIGRDDPSSQAMFVLDRTDELELVLERILALVG